MSPRPRRNEGPSNLQERILSTAWKQIAESGAAALSLRAIARELGITAPAIYNYYPDRDALVTALIVEAFTSLGDTQAQAVAFIPEQEYALRLRMLGLAYRDWAVTYPERYQLIFGTPIAGYHAPVEITAPAAARSLGILADVLQNAYAAGQLHLPKSEGMTPELLAMFQAWQSARGEAEPEALYLALTIWGFVHGLVSLEIGNQYPPFITDGGEVYRRAVGILVEQYF
jgi:AcrR family transcriptional regulator